ncbi:UDP-N-acetylmuramate dehydrogenase [Candidatus Kaiserbacteria bacterium]|nr:UDP-N-acetylmuramate dehydrogenase [Candidatus Kaiserbacteria bacterium]
MNIQIQENVPLAPMTTFGIGGPARFFAEVQVEEEIREAIAWAKTRNVRLLLLSGGSNILVPDEGLDALVVRLTSNEFSFAGSELEADAGCDLFQLIKAAAERKLGGWEKLAGIPGTIGGAVRGNAGAFGPEIKDFVTRVRAFDTELCDARQFDNNACDFSYRHSFFKDHPEWLVTRVWLTLSSVDTSLSLRLIEETIREREKRHIQNVRAAGSFFVNPVAPQEVRGQFEKEKGIKSREGRVPAGWLIEKVGLKGARIGGAVASEQHPNYIKNDDNATAAQVKELAQKIKDAVREKFGVELQEEAVVL